MSVGIESVDDLLPDPGQGFNFTSIKFLQGGSRTTVLYKDEYETTLKTAGKVRIKVMDVLAFLLSFVAIMAVGMRVYGQPDQDPVALITSPEGQWIFPLSTERVFTPVGLEDGCVVAFQAGSVRVLRSDCPEQICVRTGSISRPGQWIACVPHRVFIEIKGKEKNPVDAVNF